MQLKAGGVLSAFLVLAGLIGCSKGPSIPEPEEVTLKVWSWDGNYNEMAGAFTAKYPHIRLNRVIPYGETNPGTDFGDGFERYDDYANQNSKAMEASQADVVLLSSEEYVRLAKAGKLMSLETRIRDKAFRSETYSPSILRLLRDNGNGELFALATDFVNQALYYNKSLFERYGVPLPENGVTWEEVWQLADAFPRSGGDDSVIGFYAGMRESLSPWVLASSLGMSEKLQYIDVKNGKITINTPAWTKIWTQVADSYRSGAVFESTKERETDDFGRAIAYKPSDANRPFLSGRVAMTWQYAGLIAELEKEDRKFEWGVVSEPVGAKLGEGISMQPVNIYAIMRSTAHPDEAWQLLDFLTEKDKTAQSAKRFGTLPVRTDTAQAKDAKYSPFYEVPPSDAGVNFEYYRTDIPTVFKNKFMLMANEALVDAINGDVSVELALTELQNDAQADLNAATGKMGASE